jgi:uncharacterized SAM-binding protein YcdF (DUF218 family)
MLSDSHLGVKMFLWPQRLRLVQRRTVWCPTLFGSFCIAALLAIAVAWWVGCGESFLALTQRLPAEVLVVEGWIGPDGVRAARAEFQQRGYQYVVAAGSPTTDAGWLKSGLSYAEMTERELIQLGVPKDRIILAPAKASEIQRTYKSAMAVLQAFRLRGIKPKSLNVFTRGPHARRSHLIFTKVEAPETKVGVIGWVPPDYQDMPWWQSSDRAKEFLRETIGYVYEALLNSGRGFNSPGEGESSDLVQHSK